MPLRPIVRLGHPVIRSVSVDLSREDLLSPETQTLIEDMTATMRKANGVGIAAPQVGIAKRLFVAEVVGDNPRYPGNVAVPLTVVANPRIEILSEELVPGWEGCLSIPGLRGVVPRAKKLRLQGLDERGEAIDLVAEGFWARVIQHEVDHLDGRVYVDRMPDLRTLTHLEEWQEFWIS